MAKKYCRNFQNRRSRAT